MPIRSLQDLGQSLRNARRAKKMTQTELAALAGIQPHHISTIENGLTNPTAATLFTLTAALDLDWQIVPRKAGAGIEGIF